MNGEPSHRGALHWCFYAPGRRALDVLGGSTHASGGAEAQVAHLAASLAQLGHRVTLIYGTGRGEDAPGPRMVGGVTCLDAAPAWRHPRSIPLFWRLLGRLRPDICYARLPDDFLWVIGLHARRQRAGARFIYALAHDRHCVPWRTYDYKPWFHGPLYALGLASAHVIAAQHRHQSEAVRHGLRGRIVYVPNLIRRSPGLPDAAVPKLFDAIWVAQIRPEKRLERFLDLAESLPDHSFAVVGGFDATLGAGQRQQLETRLRRAPNLTYFGAQDAAEVGKLMLASKVLVNTSEAEGFPNTMLEAWSLGIPVVSVDVDPGSVIRDWQLGLVSGSAAALRQDVLSLTEPGTARDFAERGLAYVRSSHSIGAVHQALRLALEAAGGHLGGRWTA
ncbi:glycosyltransferase family 4 protein [Belnapia sp. T6]|uniref:Glycosyltransferase family 4 protein n=1 Tax=Belnapia mucosa TaxID=2804532 RepID=A0ABS1VBP4_9PROT|nr:glycosyltransferase family 4 protein [Belnapia mucosa]MBL6459073.1 glycosyltransferase family 4 protein [Belnapia mucosa]